MDMRIEDRKLRYRDVARTILVVSALICSPHDCLAQDDDEIQQILDDDLDETVEDEELEPKEDSSPGSGDGLSVAEVTGKSKGGKKKLFKLGSHVDWDESFQDEVAPPLLSTIPTRSPEEPFLSHAAVDLVGKEQIDEIQAATTGDALMDLPGVSILTLSSSTSAPVLRGLYGQRIALTFDGIPLMHPTVMPGPSWLAGTVDPLSLEGVEVIRGASQTTAGAFAMGGVVNFIPDLPQVHPLVSYRADGSASFRYGSVDTSQLVDADLEFQLRETAASLDLSLGNFGSLLNGAGKQSLTGYDAISFSLAVRRSMGEEGDLLFYYGTRRLGELHQPLDGTDEYMRWPHLDRDLLYLRYSASDLAFLDTLQATLGLQLFHEEPHYFTDSIDPDDEGAPSLWDKQQFDTTTLFAQVWGRSRLGGWGGLMVGIDYSFSHVDAQGQLKRLTGSEAVVQELLRPMIPDGAVSHRLAPHALLEIYALEPFLLTLGGRFWYDDLAPGAGVPTRHMVGGSAQISGRYPLTDLFAFVLNLSYGTRPPTMFELAGRSCGPLPQVESPGLDPEGQVSAELGTRWNLGILEGSLFYGFTFFHDFIYPTGATGSTPTHCPASVPFQFFNIARAWMHAIEFRNHVNIGEAWRIGAILSWQHGTVKIDQGAGSYRVWPMSYVPPLMGTAFVAMRYPRQYLWADVRFRFSLVQDRHPATEPLSGAEDDPFFLLSVRGGLDLGQHLRLYVAFENLINQVHRYLGSYIDGPGRSVMVGIEGHL